MAQQPAPHSQTSQELARGIAYAAEAGLPLHEGLEALADESPNALIRRELRTLADALRSGQSLESALKSNQSLPPHVRGLIVAGVQTGRLAETFARLAALYRITQGLRHKAWLNLLYPLILLGLLIAVLALFEGFVFQGVVDVLRDFGVRLNPFTRALAAFAGSRAWIALGAVTALAAAILALRAVLGPAMIDRIVAAVPLIGPLWRWTALTEFSGLMALLLERELPLPHALEMTSAGLTDRGLAAGCQAALEKVQQGRSLADAVCETPQFSSSLPPLLRWGELRGALPDALQAAVEMYTGRADAQADLVRTVVPPLVFLMVLAGALLILTATYAPLIQVINLLVSL